MDKKKECRTCKFCNDQDKDMYQGWCDWMQQFKEWPVCMDGRVVVNLNDGKDCDVYVANTK